MICVGKEFAGDQRELFLQDEQPEEETPYERLLSDAMANDVGWAIMVDPVLTPSICLSLQAGQFGAETS